MSNTTFSLNTPLHVFGSLRGIVRDIYILR